jgi:hypothetical protein
MFIFWNLIGGNWRLLSKIKRARNRLHGNAIQSYKLHGALCDIRSIHLEFSPRRSYWHCSSRSILLQITTSLTLWICRSASSIVPEKTAMHGWDHHTTRLLKLGVTRRRTRCQHVFRIPLRFHTDSTLSGCTFAPESTCRVVQDEHGDKCSILIMNNLDDQSYSKIDMEKE